MFKTIRIELLKLKGSKLLLISTFFPIMSIIQGIAFIQGMKGKESMDEFWMTFFSSSTVLYGMLIFPMLITIITAKITRIEHSNNGWKQLLSLPMKRQDVYLSKLIIGCGFIIFNTMILSIGIIIAGKGLGIKEQIPINIIVLRPLLAFIAALPMIAVQFYLSFRYKHVGVPLGVGAITILPIVLFANSTDYWIVYPWTYPMLTLMPNFVTIAEQTIKYAAMYGVSLISFIMITGVGLYQFRKKDII